MILRQAHFLADANVDPVVVNWLRQTGTDVQTVAEVGLATGSDESILARAFTAGRVILTHDSDFGMLGVMRGASVVGIIYLRPGHIDSAFSIASLEALFRECPEIDAPFLAVIQHNVDSVRIRVRRL